MKNANSKNKCQRTKTEAVAFIGLFRETDNQVS